MQGIRRCERETRGVGAVLAECEQAWVREDPHGLMMRAEFEWGEVDRVFAMSDIHGDARLLRRSLLAIRVIDEEHTWIGGRALVVICGDLVDDCRRNCAAEGGPDAATRRMELGKTDGANEWEVLALLRSLVAKGARIVWVTGNHELMRMRDERTGHYQRSVSAQYETTRSGDASAAWQPGGAMRELFGTVRAAVCVGDVVFLHADPIRVQANETHETARDYTRAANERSADLVDGKLAGLVWGRNAGNGFREALCAKLTRHIARPVLVVRGHCITGSATGEARGAAIRASVRTARKKGHFESAAPTDAGVTFACLRFGHEGVVSGVARVDCGASASIGLNERMSVLEITRRGSALAFREHRFSASGGARGGPRLYTPPAA